MGREEIILKEWEKRYESYLYYRNQYISTINLAVIIVGVCLTLAFSNPHNLKILRNVLMILALAVCIFLFIAHIIAQRFINNLGKRIRALEKELDMKDFETTHLLEKTLPLTKFGSLLAAIVILMLIVFTNA